MFGTSYADWNQKRIKAIIDHYTHPFFVQKKVLDLGCGHGDIGGVLHRLGADVTAVDARQDHLKVVDKKYSGVKIVRADLDGAWPFTDKKFDLVLDLGLLCHLNNFESHLKAVCASTTYLVLETAVLDSNDSDAARTVPDHTGGYDGSFNSVSSQVSVANIEKVLKSCGMTFKRMDNTKFNAGSYTYDWQTKNDGSFNIHHRRIWFCAKEAAASLPVAPPPRATVLVAPPPTNIIPFSQKLADSKAVVNYQRPIQTTRSPTPPAPAYLPPAYTPTSPLLSGKIRLFFNYYEDKNPARRREIDLCLQRNLDNPSFDLIIIQSETSPTFDFMFQKINQLAADNDISIICNSDIYFDQTIKYIKNIGLKDVYTLSRWNSINGSPDPKNQDTWIVRGKIQNVNGNFRMGVPGADGKIAYQFQAAGYKVYNPSKTIKSFHVHESGIRHYTENDRVMPDYLYVEPTSMT